MILRCVDFIVMLLEALYQITPIYFLLMTDQNNDKVMNKYFKGKYGKRKSKPLKKQIKQEIIFENDDLISKKHKKGVRF